MAIFEYVYIDPRGLNKAIQRVQHPVPTVAELVAEVANAKVFSKCDVRNGFSHVELDDESNYFFYTVWALPLEADAFWKSSIIRTLSAQA